ncbi:MAG: urease accessory protein UreE [Rhodospirillaceae bacterium]
MTLRRAVAVHPADSFAVEQERATVTLAYEDRFRRRVRLIDDSGAAFLLDLAKATRLKDGDELELAGDGPEDGGMIRVRAALEPVLEVHFADPSETARVAWHLGNRHVAVQVVDASSLRVSADHVIEGMLRGLGVVVKHRTSAFEPLGGAYGADALGGGHSHGSAKSYDKSGTHSHAH